MKHCKIPKSNKKYHYVYNIHDSWNEMDYIGVHSDDLHPEVDGYMGSSKYLDRAMLVCGKKYFSKTIIKMHPSRFLASCHEIKLHAKYDVKNNPKFHNKCNATSTGAHYTVTKLTEEEKKERKRKRIQWKKIKEEYMTAKEVMKHLIISDQTLAKWRRKGYISFETGLIRKYMYPIKSVNYIYENGIPHE